MCVSVCGSQEREVESFVVEKATTCGHQAPDLAGPQGDISDDSTFFSFACFAKEKTKKTPSTPTQQTPQKKTQEMDLEVSSVAEAAPPAPPARPPPTPAAATPHRRKPTKPVHQSTQNEKSNDNFFNNDNNNGASGGVGGAIGATPSGGMGVAVEAQWSVSEAALAPLAEGAYVEVHFPELEGQRPPGTPSDPPQGVAVQVEASTCQLTHSLKPSGFNPCTSYEVKTRFQAFAFKCSLCAA
jgi:hypothetical protein